MFETFPKDAREALDWGWEKYEPYATELLERELTADTFEAWMQDYSKLVSLLIEVGSRLYVDHTVDTTNDPAEKRFMAYVEGVQPPAQVAGNQLDRKLLASGLSKPGLEVPLKKMRVDVEIFREENLDLFVEQTKLTQEYAKTVGTQTVQWDGEERTVSQLLPVLLDSDRAWREKAWRAAMTRSLQDRQTINDLWVKLYDLRQQIAHNAGFKDFRDYTWKAFRRFDYTPQDCETFHSAIEQVVVPAAKRIYERRRKHFGYDTLRPWDMSLQQQNLGADPLNRPPLKPFSDVADLEAKAEAIFNHVDPELGGYFRTMREEKLLDLANRKGKAPGGYQTSFPLSKRPFIFMNAVGMHDDVQTLLHEGGHAFHSFEASRVPYAVQQDVNIEFCEVASMSMELLAAPYMTREFGGYYDSTEAARARIEHLEGMILFWPFMAAVDALQHWAYTHPEGRDPQNLDAKWSELWDRFMQGVDWSGLDDEKATGWQRKLHITQIPFYYVEYGLAQLGATQVWGNSLKDQAGAVAAYRRGLALGGTASLPELFTAAGATFAFDADTVGRAVALIEGQINELEPA